MNKYKILTDSCIDLPAQMIKDLDLVVTPLSIIVDGDVYHDFADEREITAKAFYQMLREEKVPTTSQLSPAEVIAAMDPVLASGFDILSISFSAALSGTYLSAVAARDEMKAKYPARTIIVIDSACASMGQGLLLTYVAKMHAEGKSIGETAAWAEDNKRKVCHLFTVGDLNHLKRGGRLSAGKAFFGTLLGIKPILHVDNAGKLVPVASARGRSQSLHRLVDRLVETISHPEEQVIYISHGDCLDDALFVKQQILAKITVKDVLINYVGVVIGSHSGLNTLAVFYMGSDRSAA
jgi:DegV family protein with EDD domain